LPTLAKSPARLKWVASANGVTGTYAARKFHIELSTTDYMAILDDPEVNAVYITTRHDTHAAIVMKALEAGKNVFVEKPLCITAQELKAIEELYGRLCDEGRAPLIMVGFNRRFATLSQIVRERVASRASPLAMTYLCNAGAIPPDHWVQMSDLGGGRIIGEACHFVDLFRFYAGAPIASVTAFKQAMEEEADTEDTVSLCLLAEDGSIGNINYFANGHKRFPKERIEVFWEGKVLSIEHFKSLRGYGVSGFSKKTLFSQDKGHHPGFISFIEAIQRGGAGPIPFEEITNVTEASLAAVHAMRTKTTVQLR
jgi:predicted dehydrogenase